MKSPRGLAELQAFDPQWCVFWERTVGAAQFAIWLPYLRRSRYRYVVMASGDGFPADVRDAILELPNCAILEPYAESWALLRKCRGFKGFLFITHRPDNFRLVRGMSGALHVWLGHGESGKRSSGSRTASLYDSVFLASYAGLRRFPRSIRRWVGDGACAIGTPIVEGAFADPTPGPRPIHTILYAPTWEGYRDEVDYSSLPEFGPLLAAAIPRLADAGVDVVVRPHPATGKRRPDYAEIVDALVAAGASHGGDKARAFAEADLMISDVSGVLSEFLFTRKPTAMPVTHRLLAVTPAAKLQREYGWVDRWPIDGLDIEARVAEIATTDRLRRARLAAADRTFRGHRSLDDAVATFDLALSTVRWRRSWIPPRYVFEARRLKARVLR
jgi:hypothetical protein